MNVAVLGANWSLCAELIFQAVVPATGLPSASVQLKAAPPHSWTSIPRCRLYHACSAFGSLALKKMPPMPMTRFTEPPDLSTKLLLPLRYASPVLRPGLRLSKPMRTKERPHQARCVDTVARAPDEPLRQRLATGPGVASSLNGIEHHRRIVSALRVFQPIDVRGDHGIDRSRSAPVFVGPTRRKRTAALQSPRGHPREPSLVRSSRIGGPVKRDHRHRSLVRAPAER